MSRKYEPIAMELVRDIKVEPCELPKRVAPSMKRAIKVEPCELPKRVAPSMKRAIKVEPCELPKRVARSMKRKAAERKEGKRSLPTRDVEERPPKRNKKQYPKITGNKDVFCWTCHRPGNGKVRLATCSECPRAYHLKCGHLNNVPETSEKWVCPECDTVQRADRQAPSSPDMSTLSTLLSFVLERVKTYGGNHFSTPVDTNKWRDYLDYVIQPMDLPKLKSNIDALKYQSVEGFLADFRWLVHSSYVYNSVHSVYTKIAKGMMHIAKQECEEVKTCSECYMHASTLGPNWFVEPCTTPHVLVWAQLAGFPYWPAKVMKQLNGSLIDVRFFGDHTRELCLKSFNMCFCTLNQVKPLSDLPSLRTSTEMILIANIPVASCFLYSRVMPCSVRSKKHNWKMSFGIEEAELYMKKLRSAYNGFCYAQYRVPYLPKEDACMRKLQLPEYPIDNETPEFLDNIETLRKEKMIEDKDFHSENNQIISEQKKSKRLSVPVKRKSFDAGSKLIEMKKKLVKIDTPQGQKFTIIKTSGSESDSSPKPIPSQLKSPVSSIKPVAKPPIPETSVQSEMSSVRHSNKTLSEDDDIKPIPRSPKEFVELSDNVSPKSLSPQGGSGVHKSFSRKLFTPPKKVVVSVSGRSGLLTRSLSQWLSTPKEEPLESDSDSDALVIAEESSAESSAEKIKPLSSETKSQVGKVSSPPEATKVYLKTQASEDRQIDLAGTSAADRPRWQIDHELGPRISVRKSYISDEKCSPTNQELPALTATVGSNKTLPISERRTVIVHKALPSIVSETKDSVVSPLVPKRARRSFKIDATSGAVKKYDVFRNESQYKSPELTEIMPTNKKPRRQSKEASESHFDEPSITDCEPAQSAVSPQSANDIVSPAEEKKSKIIPASPWMSPLVRRLYNVANEPKSDEPSKTDSKPARSATNLSVEDISSPASEDKSRMMLTGKKLRSSSTGSNEIPTGTLHKSDSGNAQPTTSSPPGDSSSPAIEEKSITLVSEKPKRLCKESDKISTEAPHIADSEHAQSSDDISSPSNEEKSLLASKKPRRLFKESHVISTDAPHETDDVLTPSTISQPSTGDISSIAVEGKTSIDLKDEEPRRPVLEKCEPEADDAGGTDNKPLVNSNFDIRAVDSHSSESKSIEIGSSTSCTRSIPAESILVISPSSSSFKDSKILCAEKNREQLDQLIPQDGEKHLDKDRPVTPASLSKNADSAEDLPRQTEKEVQPTTPVRSVIRHSTDDSPTSVNSPKSSSVTSSPKGSVLVINAVRKVPASMEVPIINVVRAQYTTPEEETKKSCNKSSKPKEASVDVAAESSSDITPVEETDDQVGAFNLPCAASEAKVGLFTSGGDRMNSTVPVSFGEEIFENPSQEAAESNDCTQGKSTKSCEDGLSEKKVAGSQETPKNQYSLDMLDGDLSHLYEDLEPPEEDYELDEPAASESIPEDEAASSEEVDVFSKTSQKDDHHQLNYTPEESQDRQSSEDAEPTSMDCDHSPVDTREGTELEKMPGTKTSISSNGSIVESALTLQPVAESPVETKTAETTQPLPRPLEGEKCVVRTRSRGLMDLVPQPAIDSPMVTEAEIPVTSEMATSKPLPKKSSSNGLSRTSQKAVKPVSPHASNENSGKCTCIMCHVAHPGASFDKAVEDYHMMKSLERVEPKRGTSKGTKESLKRMRENTAFDTAEEAAQSAAQEAAQNVEQEAGRHSYNGHNLRSSKNKRKSFNSLEQVPVSTSSLSLKWSTDSQEAGPSSGKTSRHLPGLTTLTEEVVQRRLSPEQESSSEDNSLGGLQIASSMSLAPSALLQWSSESQPDQFYVEARDMHEGNYSTAAPEPQDEDESRTATQDVITMPLPIIIKVDPDENELPEVTNNEVPPAPPKLNIRIKEISSLLEKPPLPGGEGSAKEPGPSTTKKKFTVGPPFKPKNTFADVRDLIEGKSQFISAKLKKDIYTICDQIQSDYAGHMELLEHIAGAALMTVDNPIDSNKDLVFDEMNLIIKAQVDVHVADIKKKQWCTSCGKVAQFHCCWGYNYCSEDCQKIDWAVHAKVCTQSNMTATDPYIKASPRFKALLEKQRLSANKRVCAKKKILFQDLFYDAPVVAVPVQSSLSKAVCRRKQSVKSSLPGKAKPTPLKGRKMLKEGPRTTRLEGDLSTAVDSTNISSFVIPGVAKTASTSSVQRATDQVTSYKVVQPGPTIRIINPPKQRLPPAKPPHVAAKAVPRPVVSSPSRVFSQSGKIATRLTALGKWSSVKLPSSHEVNQTPVASTSGIQRKQVMTLGRIVPSPQKRNPTTFLRVMGDKEIASILQRNHLSE